MEHIIENSLIVAVLLAVILIPVSLLIINSRKAKKKKISDELMQAERKLKLNFHHIDHLDSRGLGAEGFGDLAEPAPRHRYRDRLPRGQSVQDERHGAGQVLRYVPVEQGGMVERRGGHDPGTEESGQGGTAAIWV